MTAATRPALAAMTDRELDALAAVEILGYKWETTTGLQKTTFLHAPDTNDWVAIWSNGKLESANPLLPKFSTDLNAAAQLRQRVAEMGLQRQFVMSLLSVIKSDIEHAAKSVWYASEDDLFAIANATVRQITEACIAAVRAKGGG